jgi:hypothetical protein
MLISKFYNRNFTNKSDNNISDPRVITPTSIPIFILPPTITNNNRDELDFKKLESKI